MSDYTEQQLKDAARRAASEGDTATAKSLIARAKAASVNAFAPQMDQPTPQGQAKVVANPPGGGQVTQDANGALSFSNDVMATSDPAFIREILAGGNAGDIYKRGIDQQTLKQHPIAAPAGQVLQGIPFVGPWTDEAAGAMFGDKAKTGTRGVLSAMERQNPKTTTALNVGGGILGAIPMAVAAGPAIAANAPASLAGKMTASAGLGLLTGAADGAISGAGASEEGQRLDGAISGAKTGAAAGGILGGAAPLVGAGLKSLLTKLKGSDVKIISKELGVSPDAARMIRSALDADDIDGAIAQVRRGGDDAMLADAGQAGAGLLDGAAATGGRAATITRDAVEGRVAKDSNKLQQTMDLVFGKPQGVKSLASGVRADTSSARKVAYEAAYASPINYATGRGKALERLTKTRIPQSAIKRANELMRLEGHESGQIIAKIADDGTTSFERLPDVRQLDYIARALDDVASEADGKGKLGGTTQLGAGYQSLKTQMRKLLREEVPEYATALDTAADSISRVKAGELGYSLLRAGTTRETVTAALNGASKAEKLAAAQGVRSFVDDTLANVTRTISDPNGEAREGVKLLRTLSSRANKEKLTELLGGHRANALFDELDRATVSFDLRAAISENSKTAIRDAMKEQVKGMNNPGAIGYLVDMQPRASAQALTSMFTGRTPEAKQLRQMGVFEDIAKALTQVRGKDAERALILINSAMSKQEFGEESARALARHVVASGALVAMDPASKALSDTFLGVKGPSSQ